MSKREFNRIIADQRKHPWCDYGPNVYVPVNSYDLTPDGYHDFPQIALTGDQSLLARQIARFVIKNRTTTRNYGHYYEGGSCSLEYLGQTYTVTQSTGNYGAHIILHTDKWNADLHIQLPHQLRNFKSFTGRKLEDLEQQDFPHAKTMKEEIAATKKSHQFLADAYWYLTFGKMSSTVLQPRLRGSTSSFETALVVLKMSDEYQRWHEEFG